MTPLCPSHIDPFRHKYSKSEKVLYRPHLKCPSTAALNSTGSPRWPGPLDLLDPHGVVGVEATSRAEIVSKSIRKGKRLYPYLEYAVFTLVLQPWNHLPLPQGASMTRCIIWTNTSQQHHPVNRPQHLITVPTAPYTLSPHTSNTQFLP